MAAERATVGQRIAEDGPRQVLLAMVGLTEQPGLLTKPVELRAGQALPQVPGQDRVPLRTDRPEGTARGITAQSGRLANHPQAGSRSLAEQLGRGRFIELHGVEAQSLE